MTNDTAKLGSRKRKLVVAAALNALIMGGLAVFLISNVPDARTLRRQSEEGFPAQAAAYLAATPSSKRTMNDFNSGGYLLWKYP